MFTCCTDKSITWNIVISFSILIFNLLSKSENYKNKEGFLLYDKEFDTYLDKVLSIIKKTKKCKIIKKTERFDLYYCDSHLRTFE